MFVFILCVFVFYSCIYNRVRVKMKLSEIYKYRRTCVIYMDSVVYLYLFLYLLLKCLYFIVFIFIVVFIIGLRNKYA